jgi:hypothetical protein
MAPILLFYILQNKWSKQSYTFFKIDYHAPFQHPTLTGASAASGTSHSTSSCISDVVLHLI